MPVEEWRQYMEQASRLAGEGDMERAIQVYNSAIEKYPQQIDGYYSLAVLYHSQGRINEAIENFQKVAELNPGDASTFNNLGVLYFSKRLLKEAEASFKKAIAIELYYADAIYGLGKVYQEHPGADGFRKLEQYMGEVRDRVEILYEIDRIEEAWQIVRQLMKLSPENPENHNDYAVLCYELSRSGEAREVISKAQELAPEDANIQENYQIIHSNNWADWRREIDL